MEAVALFDFNANNEDELSFRKTQTLKILDKDDEMTWYPAEIEGKRGVVPGNYIRLKDHSWFRGKMRRKEATNLLMDKREGSFLFRRSEISPEEFSLSVKCPITVQHFRVFQDGRGKYFVWEMKFNSFNEMIDYHRTASISRTDDVRLQDLPEMFYVRALYDFSVQEDDELELKKNDVILVTDDSGSHWWHGEIDGRSGLFPARHVTKIV